MKQNLRNHRIRRNRHKLAQAVPPLVGKHIALLALFGLTVAVVCYISDAQCTMFGNKNRNEEIKLDDLGRELKLQQAFWGAMRSPEELTRISRAHGIHMEMQPRPQQSVRVQMPPPGSAKDWEFFYHPDTKAAMLRGGSPFEFVKKLPPAGPVKR